MSIEINKGKLLKNGEIIEVAFTKQNVKQNSKPAKCNEEHHDPPHPDLKKAFSSLNIHAALIGEFISPLSFADINNVDAELYKDFKVTGFTLVGEDLEQGVILSARKTLKTGKTMGFNTPVQHFEDPSDNPYLFCDDLSECIDNCKKELTKYLEEGKFAPDPQIDMFEEPKASDKPVEKIIPNALVSRLPEDKDLKPKKSRKAKTKKIEDENF